MTDIVATPAIMGRPLKFQDVRELQVAIEQFFNDCDLMEKPYTITGLALALDTTRKLLWEYEDRSDFRNTILKAKTRVENYAEQRLFTGGSPAGAIFALKNYDWTDRQDYNVGGQKDGEPINTRMTVEFIKTLPIIANE